MDYSRVYLNCAFFNLFKTYENEEIKIVLYRSITKNSRKAINKADILIYFYDSRQNIIHYVEHYIFSFFHLLYIFIFIRSITDDKHNMKFDENCMDKISELTDFLEFLLLYLL